MDLSNILLVVLLFCCTIALIFCIQYKRRLDFQIDNYISEIYDLKQYNERLKFALKERNYKDLEVNGNKIHTGYLNGNRIHTWDSNDNINEYTNGYSDELTN